MNYTSPYTIRQTMSNRRVVTYPYTIRRNMLNRRVVSSPVTSPYTIRQTTLNRRVVTAVWVLLVFAAGYFCSKSSFNAADYRGLERPAGSAVLDTWVPGASMAIIDKASLAFEADPAKHTEKAGESAPIAPSTANPPAINTQTVFKSLKDVDKPGRLAKLEQVRLSNAAIDEEKRLPVSPENEEEPSPIQHKEETGQHDIPQKIEAEKQKEKALQRSDVFEKIYSSNSWRSKETKSGSGSELIHSVQARKMIEFVIDKFKIKSWVDAPCGDFNWQHHVSNFARVNYTGLDIVPEAILDNSRKHMADLPNARFANVDLVTTRNLPYADLYLVRDVIQHLPLEDGMQIFRNVAASGAKYLLTNMHVRKSDGQPFPNQDIGAGLYYFNNPTMEPFNFPEPLYYIRDTNENFLGTIASHREIKLLGLWELDERGLLGLGTGKGLQIDWQQAGNNIVRRRGG